MSDKPKFRCHVYGCTIPAGIFHEHDRVAENYAAVMRDPVAPLTADERAELESFRREALLREYANEQLARNKRREALYAQATAMQNAYPYSGAQQTAPIQLKDVYFVPADAKIHGGRKLTQALLEAGRIRREGHNEWCRRRHIDPVSGETFEAIQKRELLATPPAPRRSFVSTTARVAFWIVLAVTVAIWIFAGVKS